MSGKTRLPSLADPRYCPSLSSPIRMHVLAEDRRGGENHLTAPDLSFSIIRVLMGEEREG